MGLPTSFAEYYHEETKYSPEGLQRHQHELDWSKEPFPYKQYTAGRGVDLKPYLPDDSDAFSDAAAGDFLALPPGERVLACLSRLLYFTNGVTAVLRRPGRPLLMRSAPSAGGLYPTEIYVAVRGTEGMQDGLYNYQVANHSLALFWEGAPWPGLERACFGHDALAIADLAIIFSAVFYRSAWRYEDRAYRRVLLDTGHVLGNLAAAVPLFGLTACPIGGFADDELNDLLFLPREDEEAIAVVALPTVAAATAKPPAAPAARPSPQRVGHHAVPAGARMLALHDASKLLTPAEEPPSTAISLKGSGPSEEGTLPPTGPDKYAFTFGEAIDGPALDWFGAAGATILRRRSTRAYSGEGLTREELGTLLDFTYHPERYPEEQRLGSPRYFDSTLLQTFVAVNAVDGVDAGCYYYAPQQRELHQIRFKNFREEVHYLCLGQRLGLDAGAVIFHTTDLPKAVERYGERAYRYLHLDAGHLGQRLNLAAVRMGLGVSGIGGFFDDQVNNLLGIPEREAVVYITTLGRPAAEG